MTLETTEITLKITKTGLFSLTNGGVSVTKVWLSQDTDGKYFLAAIGKTKDALAAGVPPNRIRPVGEQPDLPTAPPKQPWWRRMLCG